MKKSRTWGTHIEIDALSNLLQRIIVIYQEPDDSIDIPKRLVRWSVIGPLEVTSEILQKPPIFLHYFLDWHYQAVDIAENIERREWLLPFIKNGEAENKETLSPEELKREFEDIEIRKEPVNKKEPQQVQKGKKKDLIQVQAQVKEISLPTVQKEERFEIHQKGIDKVLPEKRRDRKYCTKSQNNDLYNDALSFFKDSSFIPERLQGQGKTGDKWQQKRYKWRKYIQKNFEYDADKDRIKQLSLKCFHNIPCLGQRAILETYQQMRKKFSTQDDRRTFKWYYYIPFEDEIQKILVSAHNHTLHVGKERMVTSIYHMNYSWNGIIADVRKFVKSCLLCQLKSSKMAKAPPPMKQIVALCPREIYQVDEVLLPVDLQAPGLKYLITIADHFSKYFWCTAVPTKEAKFVKEALLTFFSFKGKPKCLQSDNGSEFKNSLIESFLGSVGVEFLHGRPYHPQSQGMIENLNRRIQQALKLSYAKSQETFDLQLEMLKFNETYNNEFHFTIKETPNRAFLLSPDNSKDKYLIDRIQANQIQSFKRKIMVNDFIAGQKVLLYNFVEKKNSALIKPRKPTKKQPFIEGFFIPSEVTRKLQTQVEITISKSSQIISTFVNEGDTFRVDISLIKMISFHDWNAVILNQIS